MIKPGAGGGDGSWSTSVIGGRATSGAAAAVATELARLQEHAIGVAAAIAKKTEVSPLSDVSQVSSASPASPASAPAPRKSLAHPITRFIIGRTWATIAVAGLTFAGIWYVSQPAAHSPLKFLLPGFPERIDSSVSIMAKGATVFVVDGTVPASAPAVTPPASNSHGVTWPDVLQAAPAVNGIVSADRVRRQRLLLLLRLLLPLLLDSRPDEASLSRLDLSHPQVLAAFVAAVSAAVLAQTAQPPEPLLPQFEVPSLEPPAFDGSCMKLGPLKRQRPGFPRLAKSSGMSWADYQKWIKASF
ncbi:hypothetical protein DFJ73DRAFT_776060 [Zopfochytrium polystomum]|nr:hypothetical protein DFJ73DRAFT_776060 [Zopfochytrium polystomum]